MGDSVKCAFSTFYFYFLYYTFFFFFFKPGESFGEEPAHRLESMAAPPPQPPPLGPYLPLLSLAPELCSSVGRLLVARAPPAGSSDWNTLRILWEWSLGPSWVCLSCEGGTCPEHCSSEEGGKGPLVSAVFILGTQVIFCAKYYSFIVSSPATHPFMVHGLKTYFVPDSRYEVVMFP